MTKRRPVVLTERDYDILTLVGLVGYAGQHQLQREFFTSADRCRKRTKALTDAGFLRVTVTSSRAPRLFALTPRGRRALALTRPELAERARLTGTIALAGVPHHLGVVDARLYLAAVCRAGLLPSPASWRRHSQSSRHHPKCSMLLSWANAGSRAVRKQGFGVLRLEPDGLAEVDVDEAICRYAFEVDCRANESTRVVAKKLERYAAAFAEGLVDELWVLVVASARRVETIYALVQTAGLEQRTRVFLPEAMSDRPVASPVVTVAETLQARATLIPQPHPDGSPPLRTPNSLRTVRRKPATNQPVTKNRVAADRPLVRPVARPGSGDE